MAAHEQPEEALMRAIILACALFERRTKPPGEQEKLHFILERMSHGK
jgi:hypothetical protein